MDSLVCELDYFHYLGRSLITLFNYYVIEFKFGSCDPNYGHMIGTEIT